MKIRAVNVQAFYPYEDFNVWQSVTFDMILVVESLSTISKVKLWLSIIGKIIEACIMLACENLVLNIDIVLYRNFPTIDEQEVYLVLIHMYN